MESTAFLPPDTQAIREKILALMAKKPLCTRRELFTACLAVSGLTEAQQKDNATSSPATVYKSYIGTALSELISEGVLASTENGIALKKEVPVVIREDKLRPYLLSLLRKGAPQTKQQLFSACGAHFGTNRTQSDFDDHALRSSLGQILSDWRKNGVITAKDGRYTAVKRDRYPDNELGKCLREAANGGNVKKCFIRALNCKGGEFFEIYAAKLLEAYFKMCRIAVKNSKVTGGSDDRGIDIRLETTDWLGYEEKVFVQAKQRATAHVTLKEVREFYGALWAEHGTRGIYITTSKFHSEAAKLIASIPNLIAIDGQRLCEMAEYCGIGLLMTASGKLVLDEDFFLT